MLTTRARCTKSRLTCKSLLILEVRHRDASGYELSLFARVLTRTAYTLQNHPRTVRCIIVITPRSPDVYRVRSPTTPQSLILHLTILMMTILMTPNFSHMSRNWIYTRRQPPLPT